MCFTGEKVGIDDGHAKPEQQEHDKPKYQGEELVEVNLAIQRGESQLILISASLIVKLRQMLLALLQEFKDVIAWIYAQMPGLNPQLVTHKQNIKEGTKRVKQAPRNFRLELEV